MRVLPLENEEVNEQWLSDRDRFSYDGLYAADRLLKPMLKQDGRWHEVDWSVALEYAAHALTRVKAGHGADAIGALAAPHATLEELHLLAKLVRGLGSDNIDFRLRQSDFGLDGRREGAPWLGQKLAQINGLQRVLLVGSFLRRDQPLLQTRLRYATHHGCQLSVVHGADDDLLMPIANKVVVRPSGWVQALAAIATAIAEARGEPAPAGGAATDDAARAIARSLMTGERRAILLGNAAVQHPQAARLHAWAQWIAQATGAQLGVLTEAANTVGAHLVDALPRRGGLNARQMLEQPRKAVLLWNVEPEYDCADPAAAVKALARADTVIAFSPYRNGALDYADAILPIAPFTETAGTFVNCEGRAQSFNGAVRPAGEARPGWKVLRVLGNLLELPGFDYETPEEVRAQALPADVPSQLSNTATLAPSAAPTTGARAERLADVPIYFSDPIVRRSPPLQATRAAQPPRAHANARTLEAFGVAAGDKVRVRQGDAAALLEAALDDSLPDAVVRVSAAHESTAMLGPMFGPIEMERA
jgi:NADH-quinone oxidoreductase subunit G